MIAGQSEKSPCPASAIKKTEELIIVETGKDHTPNITCQSMCAVRELTYTVKSITNIVGKLEDKISTGDNPASGWDVEPDQAITFREYCQKIMGRVSWKNIECMDL